MNVQVVSASHCLEVDIEIEYLKNFMLARVMLNLGGIFGLFFLGHNEMSGQSQDSMVQLVL